MVIPEAALPRNKDRSSQKLLKSSKMYVFNDAFNQNVFIVSVFKPSCQTV